MVHNLSINRETAVILRTRPTRRISNVPLACLLNVTRESIHCRNGEKRIERIPVQRISKSNSNIGLESIDNNIEVSMDFSK